MIVVRAATLDDIPAIARIYTDSWKETYRGLMPDAFLESITYEVSAEKWTDYPEQPGQYVFVAYDSEQAVGMAGLKLYTEQPDCALLDALHIVRERRGQGFGKRLLGTAAREARDQGVSRMQIFALIGNDRAIQMYEHLGARRTHIFEREFGGSPCQVLALMWDDLAGLCAL